MQLKSLICIAVSTAIMSCTVKDEKKLINYVDILVGTGKATTISVKNNPGDHVNHGQTIPAITTPFAMTNWTPQTMSGETKCIAPFYFDSADLQGFRATHWTSGSCVQDYGSFTVMPVSGVFNHLPAQRQSLYFIDKDNLSPAYGAFHIPKYNVITELTATERCGFFRFSYLNPEYPTIIIDVNNQFSEGFIRIDTEKREIIASNPVRRIYNGHGESAGFSGYMVARFDCDIEEFGTYTDYMHNINVAEISNQPKMGAYVRLKPDKDDIIRMKIGTSFTSIENARKNLDAEIDHWDFDKVRSDLESAWEDLLGRIQIDGGSEDEKTRFYTALYHSVQQPRLFSDADGSYVGFANNQEIQKAEGFHYYTDFSAWDTFRAQMPLLSLIAPEKYHDMVRSLIKMAEQGGWLPIFPMWNSYTSAMIGDHCAAIIGDAIMKGFELDLDSAWKYMRKNAFEIPADYADYVDGKGRRSLRTYMEFGYIPLEDEVLEAFHQHEQVSRTLEYAYNDWVLAQVAAKMGFADDYNELMERAGNYRNVFDPERGWVNGRYIDGTFSSDFDANRHMPYITEGTPKQYSWYVPHDPEGLAGLMGGMNSFLNNLDELIINNQYWHGNEPSHHIPYLYNIAGRWDLTQKTVKEILRTEYGNGPGGLSGNDDSGQLSAWYVFSSMGFYPVCPGSNEYQLSSPLFSSVTLHLNPAYYPGKKLTLKAPGAGMDKIFEKIRKNGKITVPLLNHGEIRKGSKIVFK